MVNWIKFIAIGLIFVLSLFSFRLALQSVDSSSRRGGLYIGLIIVISVAILSLFQSLFPTIVFDGLTWRLLRYDVDFEKRLKETPLICRETGKTFDTLSDLLDLLEREHECCAYDRPCHMYDLQRAIEGGWEYKGFHFEYMVPPSVSGER